MATTNDKELFVLRVEPDEDDDFLSDTWRVYLSDEDDGPFYEVWQDTDTESVTFFNSKDDPHPQTVLDCFGPYPDGLETITEVICQDANRKGFGRVTISQPPWEVIK